MAYEQTSIDGNKLSSHWKLGIQASDSHKSPNFMLEVSSGLWSQIKCKGVQNTVVAPVYLGERRMGFTKLYSLEKF